MKLVTIKEVPYLPVVDIESKPMNAMKHLAVPANVPLKPNGKNPPLPHVSVELHGGAVEFV